MLVAGFQGVSTALDVTTLGRGGSDTTAVALAAALGGDCEIYTDVEGVYTADPRIVPGARKLRVVSPLEMLEMAGSRRHACCSCARSSSPETTACSIHVRSTFTDTTGTWIREDATMEDPIISGITHTMDEAYVTLENVPDKPGRGGRHLHRASPPPTSTSTRSSRTRSRTSARTSRSRCRPTTCR